MANAPDIEVAVAHLIALVTGAALLSIPGLELPFAAWGFVLAYNAGIPLYFTARGEDEVVSIWAFVLPLSLFQIVPDWFLAAELGTLVFPSASGALPVPLFMAGLWTMPLVLTTYLGVRVGRESTPRSGDLAAALGGLVLFGGSELVLTSVGIWEAVGVSEVGGMALYILGPEMLLCATALYAYRATRQASRVTRVAAAGAVSCLYLGAAAAGFLAVERVIVGLIA